ncbi:Hypothetical_protein [Hexamita inflata]|uniref:Hypothetical_protein n=1 Tax=Hexamita inflata TaxID=28002 RepID=A0AA86PSB0_9EUKA|nr:Hypothetical protein HINF_LOCUS27742 [Hexamita inflata]
MSEFVLCASQYFNSPSTIQLLLTEIMCLSDSDYSTFFTFMHHQTSIPIHFLNQQLIDLAQKHLHHNLAHNTFDHFEKYLVRSLQFLTHQKCKTQKQIISLVEELNENAIWASVGSQINAQFKEVKEYYCKKYSRQGSSYGLNLKDKGYIEQLNAKYFDQQPSAIANYYLKQHDNGKYINKKQLIMYIIHLRRKQ